MQAARLRRWRHQFPSWLARLGTSGFPEAAMATGLFLYVEVFTVPSGERTFEFAVNVLICGAAAASGRWPRLGAIGVAVGLALMVVLPVGQLRMSILALFIPILSAGMRGRNWLADVFTIVSFLLACVLTLPLSDGVSEKIESIIIWGLAIGLARIVGHTIDRLRRETKAHAALRFASLRRQRRDIAHDLHDTIAYATTTMIMRAEQMKLRTDDPATQADLDFIITTGRRSVRDLRSMMEALRRNNPELDTGTVTMWRLVTISDVLAERVKELNAHGLALQVSAPADIDQLLPESVRETLGKLIVEATSNMVKHAAPGPCRVLIEVEGDTVEAVFTNFTEPGSFTSEEGLGLLGAAERVEALGGEFEATAASGTWIVRAQLPLGG
ncbi:MAG TPA: histidine kinase [Propioniciclava sp.]|jgi:signal transduction histidine kinase|uniref:sensor histidine kinase n=1 Tax=Propioniciclava sp. TaxID=2038686 RepID=UPI002BCD0908|nr:histidine kinase [Propioniciclava sp.]HRL48248.1 histidine kinase [Propioniciclava sp.]HRL80807.1 histidine kinase [Propioniciclava sp.]